MLTARLHAVAFFIAAQSMFAAPSSMAAEPEVASESVVLRPYSSALKEARLRDRNVLLVFNSPFCYFCRALEHLFFTNPVGIRLINGSYVPVAFVLKNDESDPTPVTREARSVAKRLGVYHVPQVVVLSPGGAEIGRFGWSSREEVLLNLRRHSAVVH